VSNTSNGNVVHVMRQGERQCVTLTLNGRERSGYCESRELLSDFIRHELGATGTHVGCEHGVCGACTVHVDGVAGRSCLMLAVQAEGRRIDTVEGLAPDMKLGDLQQAFQRHHALQCGFCTAGILMSCADYLQRVPDPSEAQVRDMLSGHLCRCTGYTPIVAAVLDVASRRRQGKTAGETVEAAHA
jgi:2-furoyl-CoA dehydrogenase 2Fe-2S iron sulfur subunit